MDKNIPTSETWKQVEQLERGQLCDARFRIETQQGEGMLLRLGDPAEYGSRQAEYNLLGRLSALGVTAPRPIAFGENGQNRSPYMLLGPVEGVEMGQALPSCPESLQYALGRRAGAMLRRLHSVPIPLKAVSWESRLEEKRAQLNRYVTSKQRVQGDEAAIRYVRGRLTSISGDAFTYRHGDYQPSGLLLTPGGEVGFADFSRWSVGDPYEEFALLESQGIEVSIPFCRGQVDGYFDGPPPAEFWETVAVYAAHAALYDMFRAEKKGPEEVTRMAGRYRRLLRHYNGFKSSVPSWYEEAQGA